jgi:hypothetical protein
MDEADGDPSLSHRGIITPSLGTYHRQLAKHIADEALSGRNLRTTLWVRRYLLGRANVEALIITEQDTYPSELEEVFDDAWAVIKPKRPTTARPEMQLRLTLARCIVELAANGVTDPGELRRQAIERFILEEI